jgi:dTDP-4-amino-4,6-dideoxygalactose transaminase
MVEWDEIRLDFMRDFGKLTNNEHVVPVCNGSAALIASLAALGIGKHSKVIVPAFTFIAVADAVLWNDATPVFADIKKDTYCLDWTDVSKKLDQDTWGVIAVHSFGNLCKIPDWISKLVVVEDCSQNLFANEGGVLRTYSFYRSKQLNLGEGGAVGTNKKGLAEKVHNFCNHGRSDRNQFDILGTNFRMAPIVARLGSRKIEAGTYGKTYNGGGVEEGFYPYVIYHQPVYRKLGITGNCPVAEKIAEKIRQNQRNINHFRKILKT